MKKQITVIGGGENFDTHKQYISFLKNLKLDFKRLRSKGWKDTLGEKLGKRFKVILPDMPNAWNARYSEWKIWWDKIVPHLDKGVILIGHSLGGIFLAKYLSENKFPKKISAVFLIAAPFDTKDADYSLADFVLKKDLRLLQKQSGKLFIYQSQDDDVVPFADFAKYKKALPGAIYREFKNRKHFNQKNFPELISEIKKIA